MLPPPTASSATQNTVEATTAEVMFRSRVTGGAPMMRGRLATRRSRWQTKIYPRFAETSPFAFSVAAVLLNRGLLRQLQGTTYFPQRHCCLRVLDVLLNWLNWPPASPRQ